MFRADGRDKSEFGVRLHLKRQYPNHHDGICMRQTGRPQTYASEFGASSVLTYTFQSDANFKCELFCSEGSNGKEAQVTRETRTVYGDKTVDIR